MRIPIYEELVLDHFSTDYLKEKIKASKVGSLPMYTSLHNVSEAERANVVSNIEQALKELHKNPLFPYPYYIVSETPIKGTLMSVFQSVDELPSHYFKKSKRLKNKELMLLNKVGVLNEKVINMNLYENQKIIQESAVDQRSLYKQTKELNFYEEIAYLIQENEN
ncbi:hypothetical protein [Halobacteriovorax sp. JY17]|uniref:hypothetical protein n=1 Tax=Halobacteriovorax sp. JY17 TaxID=2014617 RepID=UPI000C61CE48|nr:hypothetical protein [Halobacteriovorax sp. JY17]PIK15431.1 MAG: hypothetical protein CES88_01560 [Halobacteriovorax sp. JY17]